MVLEDILVLIRDDLSKVYIECVVVQRFQKNLLRALDGVYFLENTFQIQYPSIENVLVWHRVEWQEVACMRILILPIVLKSLLNYSHIRFIMAFVLLRQNSGGAFRIELVQNWWNYELRFSLNLIIYC